MTDLEKRIYAQQCNALARGDLELYEVLKQANEKLSLPTAQVKVIIDRGVVHDVLKSTECADCSVEIVYIDPDEDNYAKTKKRRNELCADSSLLSIL